MHMKKGKTAGPDELDIDVIKIAGETLAKEFTTFLNRCLVLRQLPSKWKESNLILIHKKGCKKDLKNYRPISLLWHIYKIFTRVMCKRMEKMLEESQTKERAGFRSGFSTASPSSTSRRLLTLWKRTPSSNL